MADRDPQSIWGWAMRRLEASTTRATFDTWFRSARLLGYDPPSNTWTVGVRDRYAVEWLQGRMSPLLVKQLGALAPGPPPPSCVYVVDGGPGAPAAPPAEAEPDPGKGARAPAAPLAEAEPAAQAPPADDAGPTASAEDAQARALAAGARAKRSGRRARSGEARATSEGSGATARAEPQDRARGAPVIPYVKLNTSFRRNMLRLLKGPPLSVFLCLMLHMDDKQITHPSTRQIAAETGLARSTVSPCLDMLVSLGLIERLPTPGANRAQRYRILQYAWMGSSPRAREEEG